MRIEDILKTFCDKYGYTWHFVYNNNTHEYQIILSKGEDNAGAFLNKEELESMSEKELQDLLELLHRGFKVKFKK